MRKSKILAFPTNRVTKPEPDGVRLGFDFGCVWCAELFAGERFRRRLAAADQQGAIDLVAQFEADGLRRLPPAAEAIAAGAAP